jgi:DNA-binding CsgD family transcriptional regulator
MKSNLSRAQYVFLLENRITKRQIDVCVEVLKAKPNKEIAKILGISEKCVKQYLTSVYKKFNLRSRSELICFLHDKKELV